MSIRPPQPENPVSAAPAGEMLITANGSRTPFSKGVLSQSLLVTAMDPQEAFSVARRIEIEMMSSGAREISRHELRALVARVLRAEMGDECAERYLLWRRQQEHERPLVLLLGGTSGVGKSALAMEVARRLGIGRVLSTDSIRQIMRVLLSQALVPAIYGSSYDAFRLLPKDDGARPDVIAGFRAQATAVGVGVTASLDRTVAENAHLVIDGVSIVPGLIDLDAYAGLADVIFLVIAVGEDELRNRFVARATGQPRRLADRYLENFDAILEIQRHLMERAKQHGVAIVDNESFEVSAHLVIEHVMATLRCRHPAPEHEAEGG